MAKPTSRRDKRSRLRLAAIIAALAICAVAVLAGGAFADNVDATVVAGSTTSPGISEGGSFSETISYSIHVTGGHNATFPATVNFALSGAPSWVHLSASSVIFPTSSDVKTLTVTGTAPTGSSASSPYNFSINASTSTTNLNANNGDVSMSVTVSAPAVTDTTAPTITFSESPDGNNGWFNTAPATMTVTAIDGDDGGVASLSCTLDGNPVTLTNTESNATTMSGDILTSIDGDHTVACQAADSSNNSTSSDGPDLMLDTVAPTVSGAPTTNPNTNGWYNSAVTIGWTCTDATSGVLAGSCPPDSTISTEGSGETVNSGLVYDNAGNSSSADSPAVNIDETGPTVNCTAATPDYAGGGGWYATNQSVSCTASDGLSGLADSGDSSFSLGPTTIADDSYGSQTLGPQDVYDNAGNSTSTGSFPLQIDRQAPTISDDGTTDTPTGFDGLLYWYDHAVSVNFSASDGGSGLASSCPLSWNVPTSGDGLGVTAFSGSCADNVGNTNSGITSSGYNVDTVAPTVAVTGPTDGASYTLGSVPTAGCLTTDGLSGVQNNATVTVTGGNADGVGTFTATCTGGEDYAGNTAAPVSVIYSVAYHFGGFLAPVNNPNTVNTGKAGRTYPVKWQLTDANGNYISDLAAVTSVTYKSTTCGAFSTDSSDALETTATGGTSLRYDSTANQYVYNWATSTKGCYTLFLKLNDGSTYYAYFSLS